MFSGKKNLLFVFGKTQEVPLHMLFVFFPIWAVYLDEKKKVLSIHRLNPFVSACSGKARYVLEMVEEPPLKKGEVLTWELS